MRHFKKMQALGSLAALALLAAGCSAPANTKDDVAAEGLGTPSAAVAQAAKDFKGPFTYWIGLTFPESSNDLEAARIKAWGDNLGIKTEVVKVNQNEVVQQASGAIEAKSLPSAMTVPYDLMSTMATGGQLTPVPDAYAAVGQAHQGWLKSIDAATKAKSFGGKVYGVPFGFFGNVLFSRADLLKEKGFNAPPRTWDELLAQSKATQNPPKTYGMGFALSNVLDGNLTTSMMQSFGGRVADDAGRKCTIDSPQTASFLKWIKGAFDAGQFPPSAVTWDGAGDNNSYTSGQSLFIVNTGSVYQSMKKDDPDLAKASAYSALPAGPAGQVAPVDPRYRVVPASTSAAGKILAQDLFKALADDTYMAGFMENATYGPVLNSQLKYPVFTDSPVHAGLLQQADKGTAPAYPDTANAAYSDYQNAFSTPRMVQRVLVDKVDINTAMAQAQASCQKIYDQHAS
ncbi:ABC transporter substrate-binding protein [Arthrobacter sp. STN4]|uniref:ABC transporter substrate-binding protein n=1 Tax=Arthrobacter sp. STN4 TaxID=2923276 RepID=UPI00211A018B|nr:extracellular solute-binding protein [Arthrobacter sp. STN4]MCQ9162459.1 extracellular solute-binding protein [Arthrobacter sp. STN4]